MGKASFMYRSHSDSLEQAHLKLITLPRRLLSVSLKLSARSRSQDGLILLLSDAKQMDFAVLKLMGGKVMLSADLGKGPTSITSPVAINDGQWHSVSLYA